jgi:fatty-acyl-CoA synthase
MAVYKAPRRVLFVDALPRTATGKILRRALRDLV